MWALLAEVAVVVAVEAVVDSFFDDQGKPYGLASAVNLWGVFLISIKEKSDVCTLSCRRDCRSDQSCGKTRNRVIRRSAEP